MKAFEDRVVPDVAFEAVFRQYFKPLCFYALKYVKDLDTAKEVVHEVYINLWIKKEEVDLRLPVKPYLFTAVHNRCLNVIRDKAKFHPKDATDIPQIRHIHESEFTEIEKNELEIHVNVAVSELPERCSEVFLMSRMQGMKYREIAEKLGISEKAVEAQMTKALRILRERLKGYLPGILLAILYFLFNDH